MRLEARYLKLAIERDGGTRADPASSSRRILHLIKIRRAEEKDSTAVARVLIDARQAAMPDIAAVRTGDQMQRWVLEEIVRSKHVLLACDAGSVLGFAALRDDWLDHLYVHPEAQGRGVGRLLLNSVKLAVPQGFSLLVFQRNTLARTFYERQGLILVRLGDGRSTDEGEPEAIYYWPV